MNCFQKTAAICRSLSCVCGIGFKPARRASAVVLVLGALACNAQTNQVQPALSPVSRTVCGFAVSVDPRIELLMTVQYLGKGSQRPIPGVTRLNYSYTRDVKSWFGGFANHPAVRLSDQMWDNGFWLGAPVETVLCCSMPPQLQPTRIPVFPRTRAGGEAALRQFVNGLSDFARDSRFAEFYQAHREFYQQAIDRTAACLQTNWLPALEAYYGTRQASYTIVHAMLGHDGGFGPRIDRENGAYDVYGVIGPSKLKDGVPVFQNSNYIRYLVWHEFSHSFINPMTEQRRALIAPFAGALAPIQKKMERQGCGDWENTVEEHLVRAIVVRLVQREIGAADAAKVLKSEENRGFVYVPALCEKLEFYEQHRDKYPTLESYYGELVKVFAQPQAPQL